MTQLYDKLASPAKQRLIKSVAYRRQLRDILFPVSTVERRHFQGLYGRMVETIDVDAESVRMRTRYVVGFDAAVLAKIVLSHPGIKRVCRYRVFT